MLAARLPPGANRSRDDHLDIRERPAERPSPAGRSAVGGEARGKCPDPSPWNDRGWRVLQAAQPGSPTVLVAVGVALARLCVDRSADQSCSYGARDVDPQRELAERPPCTTVLIDRCFEHKYLDGADLCLAGPREHVLPGQLELLGVPEQALAGGRPQTPAVTALPRRTPRRSPAPTDATR